MTEAQDQRSQNTKEQAYNIINIKDSRTQRQSNLKKFKEARFKIPPQEFVMGVYVIFKMASKFDMKLEFYSKVGETVALEVIGGAQRINVYDVGLKRADYNSNSGSRQLQPPSWIEGREKKTRRNINIIISSSSNRIILMVKIVTERCSSKPKH
ncbi:hypothetical protein Tco_1570186 [Tanacetum coccineum]